MPIKFRCEHCQQLLGISQTKSGENVDCPTCGRSVRVPSLDGSTSSPATPKWDSNDQSLLNALDSLASLSEIPPHSPPTTQSDQDEPLDAPQPVVISEPMDLPPLGKPVILSEPSSPVVAEIVPESTVEAASSPESLESSDPFAKLAALSPAPLAQHASEPHPGATERSANSVNPATIVKQGITLPVVAIMMIVAFGLGFFLGGKRDASELANQQNPIETDASEANSAPTGQVSTNVVPPKTLTHEAIEGRISYRVVDSNTRPDEGAVVIFLPAYRKSSARLPIVGFRPADSTEDREIARAAIRALGGDLVQVGEDGLYASALPQAGEYHVIVLSRHAQRSEEAILSASDRVTLGEYFDRPQQLLGQLAYQVGKVTYRGEQTEIWDHAFEAS